MSLTDPSMRWWNRHAVRRRMAWGCWIISVPLVFPGSWTFTAKLLRDNDLPSWLDMTGTVLFVPGVLLLVAGGILYQLSEKGEDTFHLRAVLHPLMGMFLIQGLGVRPMSCPMVGPWIRRESALSSSGRSA